MNDVPKLMQKFCDGDKIYQVVGIYHGPAVILKDDSGEIITTGVGGATFQSMKLIGYDELDKSVAQ